MVMKHRAGRQISVFMCVGDERGECESMDGEVQPG